jgi:hypothetical protein
VEGSLSGAREVLLGCSSPLLPSPTAHLSRSSSLVMRRRSPEGGRSERTGRRQAGRGGRTTRAPGQERGVVMYLSERREEERREEREVRAKVRRGGDEHRRFGSFPLLTLESSDCFHCHAIHRRPVPAGQHLPLRAVVASSKFHRSQRPHPLDLRHLHQLWQQCRLNICQRVKLDRLKRSLRRSNSGQRNLDRTLRYERPELHGRVVLVSLGV